MKLILCSLFFVQLAFASNDSYITSKMSKSLSQSGYIALKQKIKDQGYSSIKSLMYVMRNNKFPIQNRWRATFLLGTIMGDKSAHFISKFNKHPNWMMRLASLKVLTNMQYKDEFFYRKLITDKSLLIRNEVLESIRKLKIKSLAPKVWSMLYDKKNYHKENGIKKRSVIINKAIRVVADLDYKKALKPIYKMVKNSRYADIKEDLNYSIKKLKRL
ncbi:MAG: hypothetical protein N4A33_01380 [Bacteriovoracaceae bacterium]|jgi:hypothetical protein|nr:hypothetical protein [Bacteriovoracaceae bacterium]